jgi:hypothetical protein
MFDYWQNKPTRLFELAQNQDTLNQADLHKLSRHLIVLLDST